MSRSRVVILALLAALLCLPAAARAARPVELLTPDVADDFPGAIDAVSTDGTRVVLSTSDALVPADDDTVEDVYEIDDGVPTLLSTGPNLDPLHHGNPATFDGASADCSIVYFSTFEPLVSGDTDLRIDIYRRAAGTTLKLTPGNGDFNASYGGNSPDGARLYFETKEQLLPASDTDSSTDVYANGSSLEQISKAAGNAPSAGNGASDASFEGASDDGTRVYFSTSERLDGGDSDSASDVYERFNVGGNPENTKIVTAFGNTVGQGAHAAIFDGTSSDGRYVFFSTDEGLDAAIDDDGDGDVYRFDTVSGTQAALYSDGPGTSSTQDDAHYFANSADGSRLLFSTNAPLVSADADTAPDLYRNDGGSFDLVSRPLVHGTTPDTPADVGGSADLARVRFTTNEPLVSGDTDSDQDVYTWDETDGAPELASVTNDGANFAGRADFAGASADATHVLFRTSAAAATADTDGQVDVYDRTSRKSVLMSPSPFAGAAGFEDVPVDPDLEPRGISADGSRVFLVTSEKLTDGDCDTVRDLYVVLPTGATPHQAPSCTPPQPPPPTTGGDTGTTTTTTTTTPDTTTPTDTGSADSTPAPPGASPPSDTTPPAILSFAVARGRTLTFRYTLGEGGRVRIAIQRCARARRCRAVATLDRAAVAGANQTAFRRRLAAGAYRATLTATDAAGNSSAPVTKTFRVKRR